MVGLVALILMIMAMMITAVLKMKQKPHINYNSDLRINYITEAIKGIRTIKSCCFEEYTKVSKFHRIFINKIREKRDLQIKHLITGQRMDTILFVLVPTLTTFIS